MIKILQNNIIMFIREGWHASVKYYKLLFSLFVSGRQCAEQKYRILVYNFHIESNISGKTQIFNFLSIVLFFFLLNYIFSVRTLTISVIHMIQNKEKRHKHQFMSVK